MVFPLCYGIFVSPGGRQWLQERFQRQFSSIQTYLSWLGETGSLEGNVCIQGNRVAAEAMAQFE
jgi:hypothetical protein